MFNATSMAGGRILPTAKPPWCCFNIRDQLNRVGESTLHQKDGIVGAEGKSWRERCYNAERPISSPGKRATDLPSAFGVDGPGAAQEIRWPTTRRNIASAAHLLNSTIASTRRLVFSCPPAGSARPAGRPAAGDGWAWPFDVVGGEGSRGFVAAATPRV